MALFAGMKVTIMGLGINGGGMESAKYLALNGAECTITDMKDEKILAPSIEELQKLPGPHPPFRFVLGRHEMEDFTKADMVIKNPAVRPDSPYLAAAHCIETDISLFLASSPARLIAVTGSKGKSITASAIHWVLSKTRENILDKSKTPAQNTVMPPSGGMAFLGGNITVSPLSFLDQLSDTDDVVLELSSWQLGDLQLCSTGKKPGLIKPRSAILTSIMPDHQDRYGGMDAYVNDKRIIYQGQDKEDATIACIDDHWGLSFLAETSARCLPYSGQPFSEDNCKQRPEFLNREGNFTGAWLDPNSGAGMISCSDGIVEVVPPNILVPGIHNKKNCLAAALALVDLGIPGSVIREHLESFPGIEHRLEFFREIDGIRFYNDTAATIPEAAAAAIKAFTAGSTKNKLHVILVAGGTDKNLDFSPLVKAVESAGTMLEIILLAGTGSEKLSALLKIACLPFYGPFENMEKAARTALELGDAYYRQVPPAAVETCPAKTAGPKPGVLAVLSPGCTSFGMFTNEFDRGRKWKEAVCRL